MSIELQMQERQGDRYGRKGIQGDARGRRHEYCSGRGDAGDRPDKRDSVDYRRGKAARRQVENFVLMDEEEMGAVCRGQAHSFLIIIGLI